MAIKKALKKIKVRTLIIVGEKDFITKPKIGIKIHKQLVNSELVKIPNTTHFAHIEAPDIFYEVIEKFMKEN